MTHCIDKTVADLYARVDNVLAMAERNRILAGLAAWADIQNAQLCRHCHKTLGEHSHIGWFCPPGVGERQKEKFLAVRCYALIGGGENPELCEKDCVPGTEVCKEHTEGACAAIRFSRS